MKTPANKYELVQLMTEALLPLSEVEALWLGGSRATGTEDELSDTDLVVVSAVPKVVFTTLEASLSHFGLIEHIWNVETSIWRNFHQKFYTLKGFPPFYFLDIGVFTSLQSEDYREFFNRERHGNAEILLDRSGILARAAANPLFEELRSSRNDNQRAQFEILYRTFSKEAARGKFIDSFLFYNRLIMFYVASLRAEFTPQKHDFGLRYLYRDLPADRVRQIEGYMKCRDLASMQKSALEMRTLYLARQ